MMAFESIAYFCACKQEVIGSKYSGEYAQCSCGQCAVDQTEHYVRWIGAMLERAPEPEYKTICDDNNSSNKN